MKQTTSERLAEAMRIRGLRQIDVVEKLKPLCEQYNIKFGRNNISQYLSGKVLPKQDKLVLLSRVLNVSEAWLMGFDVPMERQNPENTEAPIVTNDERFQLAYELCEKLNDKEMGIVKDMIRSLVDRRE